MSLLYDSPLDDPTHDLLGRAPFARALADAVLSVDAEDGFVFALHGPWGSGKTSTLNFVLHYLGQVDEERRPIVVHFNPWWFSGRDQLIQQFFNALRQSLAGGESRSEQLNKLGQDLDRFARVLTPLTLLPTVAEPTRGILRLLKGTSDSAKAISESLATDAYSLRHEIDKRLRAQSCSILIVIDDLDRLPADEIRQVFQLVKAVADFPKTTYLLAYDHELIVRALEGQQPGRGEDYLEKIVQSPFDLPPPDATLLYKLLFTHLDRILKPTPDELFDQVAWGNIFHDGIARFIRSPRDVKRLANALQPSYPPVRDEVAAHEFIAVQALRTFAPSLYRQLSNGKKLFAGPVPDVGRYREDPKDEWRIQFDAMLQDLPEESREPASALMKRLFPRWDHAFGGMMYGSSWGGEWRRKGRVCSPDVFDLYFRLSVPVGGLGRARYLQLISTADAPQALADELRSFVAEKAPDGRTLARVFLEGIQDFTQDDIGEQLIPGFLTALFIAGDDLIVPSDGIGMFNLGNDMQMIRIIHQLLSRVDDKDSRLEILREAITEGRAVELPTREVSIRYQGLDEQEKKNRVEEELLDRDQVDQLKMIVLDKIRSAAENDSLLFLPGLSYVLYRWREWAPGEPEEYVEGIRKDDEAVVRLIHGFSGFRHSAGMGDRVSRRERRVDSEGLRQVTGWTDEELAVRARKVLDKSPAWLTADQEECLELLSTPGARSHDRP